MGSLNGNMGNASISLMRVIGPSLGHCELSVSQMSGLYQLSCIGFDGQGGPLSYAVALAFNPSVEYQGKDNL